MSEGCKRCHVNKMLFKAYTKQLNSDHPVHEIPLESSQFAETNLWRLSGVTKGDWRLRLIRFYVMSFEGKNISIFHGCMVRIDKSVTRVTDQHHEACRVMPNSDPE